MVWRQSVNGLTKRGQISSDHTPLRDLLSMEVSPSKSQISISDIYVLIFLTFKNTLIYVVFNNFLS